VLRLFLESNYGVRTPLLKRGSEYLAEPQLIRMIETLESYAEKYDVKDYTRYHALLGLEILAHVTHNPELFESSILRAHPENADNAAIDIARAYHEYGRNDEALERLERIHEGEMWQLDEKDELLFSIYHGMGKQKNAEEAAWRLFDRGHTMERFNRLVAVIGPKHRERLLDEQATAILEQDKYQQEDAIFLVNAGRNANAACYLIRWEQKINGNDYYSMLPIAQELEDDNELLASTVIYRALLNSILNQTLSKAYYHAAEYLHILDMQNDLIRDWGTVLPHSEYKDSFHAVHKRKWRFWKIYEGYDNQSRHF